MTISDLQNMSKDYTIKLEEVALYPLENGNVHIIFWKKHYQNKKHSSSTMGIEWLLPQRTTIHRINKTRGL